MSLNKFMHPRNKYRKPPDFKALAIKYPEFRKHAKQDISGKIKFNFKDLEAVRVLTCTLLKEDFDLDVDIPSSRLIPTLPLRLNYLLWLEDIVKSNKPIGEVVKGIDIGCGASCVYPLLAAKHFGWHMLATEVDTDSAFTASSNVRRNKLQHMIVVRSVKEDTVLAGVLEADTVYNFCMCNPPFFGSEEELDPQKVARSASRPLPRNAHSGAPGELVFEGGELAFVTRIIQDSVKLKEQIRVYSVMVGHKSSVAKVKRVLQETGVTQVATTEFCQGHTTRWGIAWTLVPSVIFPQATHASTKKNPPFSSPFEMDMATLVEKLKKLMDDLQITYSKLKTDEEVYAMEITAERNTWSNSRRKRRQEKRKQMLSVGNSNEQSEDDEDVSSTKTHNNKTEAEKLSESNVDSYSKQADTKESSSSTVNNIEDYENRIESNGNKRKKEESNDEFVSSEKKPKLEDCVPGTSCSVQRDVFLSGSLVVKSGETGSVVEICWLRGVGGREAAHQVLHYFKNNLETH